MTSEIEPLSLTFQHLRVVYLAKLASYESYDELAFTGRQE